MIFKCKICGGNLEIKENSKIVTCEYCGSEQVLPKVQNEKKTKLYDRAIHYKENNEYDKAITIFEETLNEDNTDCEIYWQLTLCEYGVQYVKDKESGKYIPTCNRTKKVPIFINDNYKNAIKYANEEQKKIYEEEAKNINLIQKNAIKIAEKEEPFDIFICYKETDENKQRTQDSVIAQDLYNNLTKEGYKVFFSKITLENKLGTEYEPYIFAALNSAKVMIIVGTKKENYIAPWVKNEWSRFLSLAKEDDKKIIIPTYKDMSPYDLPEEFAHLQALDLGKIGIIEDLKNKINITLNNKSTKNRKKAKTEVKLKKRKKRIKISIISIVVILILAIGIIVSVKEIIPGHKYKNANNLMDEEKYSEAVTIFEEIKEYKDSKDKIVICNNKQREKIKQELEKYIGKYDKTEIQIYELSGYEEPFGYILEITEASSAGIKFSLTYCRHKVIEMSTKANLKGDIYEFSYKDSWMNKGEGTLELLEDGVKINIINDDKEYIGNPSIGKGEIIFKFSDKVN